MQLEQAITEAQDQHRRLKEQAANVIANQKQAEMRLNGKMAELEKLNANARQALMMASDAEKAGDAAKAAQYNGAAETIANQLIQVEKDVEGLKTMVLDSTQASDQAKAAVQQNSRLLQEKLAEKNKLLSPARAGQDARRDEQGDVAAATRPSATTCRRSTKCSRRSRPATRRPRRRPSCRSRRSSRASSRSSRPPPTSRRRAASASCAPSSVSTPAAVEAALRRRPAVEEPKPVDRLTRAASTRFRSAARGRRGG